MKYLILILMLFTLASCSTVNVTVQCGQCTTQTKNVVKQSRADSIRAAYYQVNYNVVYKDNADEQHRQIKKYIKTRN